MEKITLDELKKIFPSFTLEKSKLDANGTFYKGTAFEYEQNRITPKVQMIGFKAGRYNIAYYFYDGSNIKPAEIPPEYSEEDEDKLFKEDPK